MSTPAHRPSRVTWVGPDIVDDRPTTPLLVGRDPGNEEMWKGRPFVGQAGAQLDATLASAGTSRSRVNVANVVGRQPEGNDFSRHKREDVERGLAELDALVASLRPNIVVAMGNEAAWALVGDWPGARDGSRGSIYGARDISRRRGYFWDAEQHTLHGCKVLTTLHPSAVMRDVSGISEMLAAYDMKRGIAERADAELVRPRMNVQIVRSAAQAEVAAAAIRAARIAACDIEITKSHPFGVLCVGFAPTVQQAYVFTTATLRWAYALLEDASLGLVWQNGQFDLHFLLTRANVRVRARIDDTIVAWHSRWPEIAGSAVDVDGGKKGAKSTRKSLAFFGSLFSKPAWWKDYATDADGMALLCGKDCCLTLATHNALQEEMRAAKVAGVYSMSLRRIWPVVEMQNRGLLVDETRRVAAMTALAERKEAATLRLRALAHDVLDTHRERLPRPGLIWKAKRCACCGGGVKARVACPACSGVPKDAKKPELVHLAERAGIASAGMNVAALRSALSVPCRSCAGAGKSESYAFNPASNVQMAMLLYDVLRLPRQEGVDEATLKRLLATVRGMQQGDSAGRPGASASSGRGGLPGVSAPRLGGQGGDRAARGAEAAI